MAEAEATPGDPAEPGVDLDQPAEPVEPPVPPGASPRRRPRWLRFVVMAALTFAAILYGVVPSLVSARNDLDLVKGASWVFLSVALVLQIASWLSYTALTRAVLPRGTPVGWPSQFAIDMTGFGVSHVIPGGGATAMGLRYQMMTSAGIAPPTVVTTTATQTVLSDVALAACYLLGAVLSVPTVMEHRSLQLTAGIGLVLVVVLVVGSTLLVRGHSRLVDRLEEAQTRVGAWLQPRLTRVSQELVAFLRDSTRTVQAGVFSMANWLLDAACLYVCLEAYNGDHVSAPLVLTAYGFASLVGLLPVTPGGLGIIEGTLIPLLIAFGTSSPVAVLGVLTWRVLQFWLPVAVAAVCYLALRLSGRLGRRGEPLPSQTGGAPPGASSSSR